MSRPPTRAQIIAQYARDIDRGIEWPDPETISAVRALVAALARAAVKSNVTWADDGSLVRDSGPEPNRRR